MTIVAPTFADDLSAVPDEELLLHVLTGEWIPASTRTTRRQMVRASRPSAAGTVVPATMDGTPVWEITSESGRVLYIQRAHIPGFRPVGLTTAFSLGTTRIHVVPSVQTSGRIFSSEGYQVPESWYEEDV